MNKKNIWVLLIFLLSGIVIGGLLGELAQNVTWLEWLNYGETFGLDKPVTLDLNVVKFIFGITIKIKISGIIGMFIGLLIYKKI